MAIESGCWDFEGNQPVIPTGILWYGRLDNAADLARELGLPSYRSGDEAAIVAGAYRRWGVDTFSKLIGDWSLVLWDPRDQSLLLARDFIGLRPLYYSFASHTFAWSSSLDHLLRNPVCPLDLDLEYLAGWLSLFPRAEATPYSGIRAVPPAAFVQVRSRGVSIHKYWNFDPGKNIRLRDDSEYEEQFRWHFANAVRRRLRSHRPLLAELSGGMDSSSIVCVADRLITHETGLTPRLDTMSCFDDSEPNWNERPYFTAVETQRGRQGHHVPADATERLRALLDYTGSAATPAECGERTHGSNGVPALIAAQGYAALLSGIGGDEFTGGVPTAVPELADLLAGFHPGAFVRQAMSWALTQRRPLIHLSVETLLAFAPPVLTLNRSRRRLPAWVIPTFGRRYRDALHGYQQRLQFSGPLPSFQENLSTLEAIRRQIASSNLFPAPGCEKRFPFLDRDLLEFLFAIPRQQIIKPGRRRFLMRQSLAGIVPQEILDRKRKAYITLAPRAALASLWPNVLRTTTNMLSESLGLVSSHVFRQSLENLRDGIPAAIVPLFRTLALECWLRNLANRSVVPGLENIWQAYSAQAQTGAAAMAAVCRRCSAG